MPTLNPPLSTEIHDELLELGALWEVARDCRTRISTSFGYLDRETVEALALIVSELAENIIKYAALESLKRPSLAIRVTPERILVQSENTVRSDYDARLACRMVAKVAAETHGQDAVQAYANAIQRTLSSTKTHSRQGFYRISAVAGFQLRAERDGDKLVIVGERTR